MKFPQYPTGSIQYLLFPWKVYFKNELRGWNVPLNITEMISNVCCREMGRMSFPWINNIVKCQNLFTILCIKAQERWNIITNEIIQKVNMTFMFVNRSSSTFFSRTGATVTTYSFDDWICYYIYFVINLFLELYK